MNDFRAIAATLAADIAEGRLQPGDRLPPQRELADRHGIAVSTASRVYAELVRRGLVTGEVGRGTYVRAGSGPATPALAEPALTPTDLELNFPLLPEQPAELLPAIASLLRPDALRHALRPLGASATPGAREIASRFLARRGWTPDPAGLLFTGNGRQAIAATLAAVAPIGSRIGVEAMTYPVIKGMAARLGLTLIPLALDEHGLRPDALVKAHRTRSLQALYVQPALHNPLGVTMTAKRRAEIAAVLHDTKLVAIEDAIYSFLANDEPLAALAPERIVLVESLSKRIAPGLTLGFIAAPPALTHSIAGAIRSGGWLAAGFPFAASMRWMGDGTAARLAANKCKDAIARQRLARKRLAGLSIAGDPRAYHLWLNLPDAWRAEAYAAAAARHGIAITPASAFAVTPGHAPNAVRLALASPSIDALADALTTLRRLASTDPRDAVFVE